MSVEATIQRVREGIINDLIKLSEKYEPLRESAPQLYVDKVEQDIKIYLDVIKTQPVMLEFYDLCMVDQEEFIDEILEAALNRIKK